MIILLPYMWTWISACLRAHYLVISQMFFQTRDRKCTQETTIIGTLSFQLPNSLAAYQPSQLELAGVMNSA